MLFVLFAFLVFLVLVHIFHNAPRLVTVVSGYWKIKSKHTDEEYDKWFKNTLQLNAPYVFFHGDEETKTRVESFRKNLPTVFVKRDMKDFYSQANYNDTWTHEVHVPTTDVGKIWIEKVKMVEEAAKMNYFDTEWFAWVDAGNAYFRYSRPSLFSWPSRDAVSKFPKDKIIYVGTNDEQNRHDFAGGAFMYHKNIIQKVSNLFYEQYLMCQKERNNWECGSDQCIFTELKKRIPEMFHRLGDGHGGGLFKYM